MADTIVNTPSTNNDNASAGWFVAVIVLLAVIVGGFVWYRYYRAAPAPAPTTNIQVTVPAGTTGSSATQ